MKLGLGHKHLKWIFGTISSAGLVYIIIFTVKHPSLNSLLQKDRRELRRPIEIIDRLGSKHQLIRDFDMTSIIVQNIPEKEHFIALDVTVEGHDYKMECFADVVTMIGQLMSRDFCLCLHTLLTDEVGAFSFCQKKIRKQVWHLDGYELKTIQELRTVWKVKDGHSEKTINATSLDLQKLKLGNA